MGKFIDLTGMKFNRLTVLKKHGVNSLKKIVWLCLCDCGKETIAITAELKNGKVGSCGCLRNEIIQAGTNYRHGKIKSSEYGPWTAMRARCNNPKFKNYKYYGGRGITVCERWENFDNFLEDMGPRPTPKHSIERIDTNGNYEPGNCKWANDEEQMQNRRMVSRNKSGVNGVHWNNWSKKWAASIGTHGKQLHIGYFDTVEEAAEARKNAEKLYWSKPS
jgi:hypothetical protein